MATLTPNTIREIHDQSLDLRIRVQALISACPYALGITSSWRSRAEQQRLYDGWVARKPGFNPANPPGHSKHEHTLPDGTPAADACDLSFTDQRAMDWAHQNCGKYGLHFPFLPRETWHVESDGSPAPQPATPTGEWSDMATQEEIRAVFAEEIAKVISSTHADALVLLRGTKDGTHPENIANIYADTQAIRKKLGA